MRATRSGPLFNAFPYPTKISPETIALFIAAHTKPGAVIFDGFAGSGTTGLGALLCSNPSQELQDQAQKLGLSVQWGPRRAILYEISVLGSLVARVLCSPPDPDEFHQAAQDLLQRVTRSLDWLYTACDPEHGSGEIRYVIWSDILECPECHQSVSLWHACVSRDPAEISGVFHCPLCQHEEVVDKVERVMEVVDDDLLGVQREIRSRRPVWVYGETGGRTWSRELWPSDLDLLHHIDVEPLPQTIPNVEIPWGDLYRSGYHAGITHLHHFYTRRNLLAFSTLWAEIERYPSHLTDALKFWLLSYNASHTTLMTRVVAKKAQKDLVVTSAQPGVLYVSGLPVEKNVFSGLQRKLKTIVEAFRCSFGSPGLVSIHNASCLSVDLPDESVDYVFTDPPFGGNIPYAEVNFINEAWLGTVTATKEEIIVSPHQNKKVADYQGLLVRAFQEVNRILRRDSMASVVFHSTSAQVWNALRLACEEANLSVAQASVLDKSQGSFKQVTTNGAVRGDPILLLTKQRRQPVEDAGEVWTVVEHLIREATLAANDVELTPQRLYSRIVAHYLAHHQNVPIDAGTFYSQLAKRQE